MACDQRSHFQLMLLGAMALVGQIFLRWLLEEYFPLHAEFVEQPQPLCHHMLGKWHRAETYYDWARSMMQCLLLGGVPRDRRLEVRLQLQRAGRIYTSIHLISTRDIGRASRFTGRPIAAGSDNMFAFPTIGESQSYVNMVKMCLEFMEQRPMSQAMGSNVYHLFLQGGRHSMQDQVERLMDRSLCDFQCYQSSDED